MPENISETEEKLRKLHYQYFHVVPGEEMDPEAIANELRNNAQFMDRRHVAAFGNLANNLRRMNREKSERSRQIVRAVQSTEGTTTRRAQTSQGKPSLLTPKNLIITTAIVASLTFLGEALFPDACSGPNVSPKPTPALRGR